MRELTVSTPALLDHPADLLARLRTDGYVFVRNLLPAGDVWATRRHILDTLVRLGWARADDPALPAIPVPDEGYREGAVALQKLESVHRLGHHERLRALASALLPEAFGHPARVIRVVWPQRTLSQRYEMVHQDWRVFHAPDMLTTWFPLGDVPVEMGPLRVLTGSHRDGTVCDPWLAEPLTVPDDDPRWATADFHAGDVILFHCLTAHTGGGNGTERFRLSMDVRWQSATRPVPEVALWPHVDLHFAANPSTATQPGWDEIAAHWQSREPIEVPAGLRTFEHTMAGLPDDHPRPSVFLDAL